MNTQEDFFEDSWELNNTGAHWFLFYGPKKKNTVLKLLLKFHRTDIKSYSFETTYVIYISIFIFRWTMITSARKDQLERSTAKSKSHVFDSE